MHYGGRETETNTLVVTFVCVSLSLSVPCALSLLHVLPLPLSLPLPLPPPVSLSLPLYRAVRYELRRESDDRKHIDNGSGLGESGKSPRKEMYLREKRPTKETYSNEL